MAKPNDPIPPNPPLVIPGFSGKNFTKLADAQAYQAQAEALVGFVPSGAGKDRTTNLVPIVQTPTGFAVVINSLDLTTKLHLVPEPIVSSAKPTTSTAVVVTDVVTG